MRFTEGPQLRDAITDSCKFGLWRSLRQKQGVARSRPVADLPDRLRVRLAWNLDTVCVSTPALRSPPKKTKTSDDAWLVFTHKDRNYTRIPIRKWIRKAGVLWPHQALGRVRFAAKYVENQYAKFGNQKRTAAKIQWTPELWKSFDAECNCRFNRSLTDVQLRDTRPGPLNPNSRCVWSGDLRIIRKQALWDLLSLGPSYRFEQFLRPEEIVADIRGQILNFTPESAIQPRTMSSTEEQVLALFDITSSVSRTRQSATSHSIVDLAAAGLNATVEAAGGGTLEKVNDVKDTAAWWRSGYAAFVPVPTSPDKKIRQFEDQNQSGSWRPDLVSMFEKEYDEPAAKKLGEKQTLQSEFRREMQSEFVRRRTQSEFRWEPNMFAMSVEVRNDGVHPTQRLHSSLCAQSIRRVKRPVQHQRMAEEKEAASHQKNRNDFRPQERCSENKEHLEAQTPQQYQQFADQEPMDPASSLTTSAPRMISSTSTFCVYGDKVDTEAVSELGAIGASVSSRECADTRAEKACCSRLTKRGRRECTARMSSQGEEGRRESARSGQKKKLGKLKKNNAREQEEPEENVRKRRSRQSRRAAKGRTRDLRAETPSSVWGYGNKFLFLWKESGCVHTHQVLRSCVVFEFQYELPKNKGLVF